MLQGRGDADDLDRACDAAVHLLGTRGPGALSVRAIAHEMNLTGPALTHRWDSRARLWGLLVSEIGDRWLREVGWSVRDDGPAALVPSTAEEIADALEQERDLLRTTLESVAGRRLPEAVVDALVASPAPAGG